MSDTSKNKSTRAKRDTGPEAKPVIDAQGVETPSANGVATSPAETLAPSASTEIVPAPQPAQVSIEPLKQLPEDDEFGGSGLGFENASASDNVMPAITLLQSNSPLVLEAQEKGLSSPRGGDFIIKSTGQVIDGKKGFMMIMAYYDKKFVHWNKRKDKGGNAEGWIANYLEQDDFVQKALRGMPAPKGAIDLGGAPGQQTELQETKTAYALLVDEDGQTGLITLACKSTMLSAFNNIVSAMGQYRYPGRPGPLNTFSFKLHVTSFLYDDKKNDSKYYKLSIKFAGEGGVAKTSLLKKSEEPVLFELAAKLHEDCAAGRKRAEQVTQDEEAETASGGGGGYRDNGGPPPPPPGAAGNGTGRKGVPF